MQFEATPQNSKFTPSKQILKTRILHKNLKKEYFKIESNILNLENLDSRRFAEIKLFNDTVVGLTDSGTSISISGSGALEFLNKHNVNFTSVYSNVKTVSGNTLSIIEKIKTNVTWKNIEKPLSIYIAPELSQQLYLGFDFFKVYGLDVHLVSEVDAMICKRKNCKSC